jgi:hypothetical protein
MTVGLLVCIGSAVSLWGYIQTGEISFYTSQYGIHFDADAALLMHITMFVLGLVLIYLGGSAVLKWAKEHRTDAA